MKERKGSYKTNWLFFFICVGIVIIGYIFIYFGSTKIAPLLVVCGYILTGLSLLPRKEKHKDVLEKEKK